MPVLPVTLPTVTTVLVLVPTLILPLAVAPVPASILTSPPVRVPEPPVAEPAVIATLPPTAVVVPLSLPPFKVSCPPVPLALDRTPGWRNRALPAAVVTSVPIRPENVSPFVSMPSVCWIWIPLVVVPPAALRLTRIPLVWVPGLLVRFRSIPSAAPDWLMIAAVAGVPPVVPFTVKATTLVVLVEICLSLVAVGALRR